MATTNALVLNELLSKAVGDWIRVAVTTNITNNNLIVSTKLNAYDDNVDGYFDTRWIYVEDFLNANEDRKIKNYYTANGTANVYGSAFTLDTSNTQTVRLHRHSFSEKQIAINSAIKELYPILHRKLDVAVVKSGDALPNSSFRDWTASTAPDKWSVENATATANTTGTYLRGGTKSTRVVASANNGWIYVSSDDYPRLLDLMGRTIDIHGWARPTSVNNAFIQVYTRQADGSEQRIQSITANPVNEFTLLGLDGTELNDDLVQINIGCGLKTNGQSAHFANLRCLGRTLYEYLLPNDFRDGAISEVFVQTEGDCDELSARQWAKEYGWSIWDDGTDKHLRMPSAYPNEIYFRLTGYAPLSTVVDPTDTIETAEERYLNLITAYSKYKLYQTIAQPVSSDDVTRFREEEARAFAEYKRLLPKSRMVTPSGTMKIGIY